MPNNALEIKNLDFKYPKSTKYILKNLNLTIASKSRFGLFGPNGAGKTTLMRLITSFLQCPKETIKIFGEDIWQNKSIKRIYGYVPQDLSFYEELTPVQNLAFFGAWYGLDKQTIKESIQRNLQVFNLEDVKDMPAKKFSGGMKRKLNLAIGVMHQPKLLILDEPTVGVDIQTRLDIIQYLHQLNQQGTTLLYTSHQLDEASELCDQLALINQGNIIANGSLSDLQSNNKVQNIEELFIKLITKEKKLN